MISQLLGLQVDLSGVGYGIVSITVAMVVFARLSRTPNLDAIPTVGCNGWFRSWWADFKNTTSSPDIVQEGYKKHKSAPFKIAEQNRWIVILGNPGHIDELCKAPEEVLSFREGVNERFSLLYSVERDIPDTHYALAVIRSQLTRNIGTLYPEIRDEIVTAFDEVLDLKGHEWKSVPALDAMRQIVCRTSNRVFVGLPLCRDPDWIDLNIQYTIDVVQAGARIVRFPRFMRSLAAYFLTGAARRGRAQGLKLVGPMIEERLRCLAEHGMEWDGKPNDLLSWLIEEAKDSYINLVAHVLLVNFAAIHTSSNRFANALFFLAANPQYIQPLREEVESIVDKEGWSKDAIGKMHKVDSFLRECQRLEGMSPLSIVRKALKDVTFSDGTFIPRGTLIGVAAQSIHYDEGLYENAAQFEPFRFYGMRETDSGDAKCQLVSTVVECLVFGYGRHACPGRYFAANELKTMLAHIVTAYDIKLEDGAMIPQSLHRGIEVAADPHARVVFRKRVDFLPSETILYPDQRS